MIRNILLFLIFLPISTFAQIGQFNLSNELSVEIIPDYPRPYENVFINLDMYTENLNSAKITWKKDGKDVLSGTGEKKFSFKNKGVGEKTIIDINIDLLNGTSFTKTITIIPSSVDLIWEANSYVHPFYKGKALHSRQGSLKIIAMPEFVKNGQKIAPEDLIYNWSNGTESYQTQSGYGKNYIVIDSSILGKTEEVNVLVQDKENSLASSAFIYIEPTDPEIVFYENNPYYGNIFDRAIQNVFDLNDNDIEIVSVPYNFSKEQDSVLKYNWRINGSLVKDLESSRNVIFRKPEGKSGISTISLNIENQRRLLQQSESKINIKFNK